MALIENGLAVALGFVTKPLGAAVTAVALAGAVGGGLYVKNWWDGIQSLDETVEAQAGTITGLRTDLRSSELNAASARTTYERRIADLQNQNTAVQSEARNQRLRNVRLLDRLAELQREETGPISPVLVSALNSVRDDLRGFSPT